MRSPCAIPDGSARVRFPLATSARAPIFGTDQDIYTLLPRWATKLTVAVLGVKVRWIRRGNGPLLGEVLELGLSEGLVETETLTLIDDEGDWLALILGDDELLSLADGLREGLSDADGETLVLGLTLGDSEDEGERLLLGLMLGEGEELGERLALGEIEGLSLELGD